MQIPFDALFRGIGLVHIFPERKKKKGKLNLCKLNLYLPYVYFYEMYYERFLCFLFDSVYFSYCGMRAQQVILEHCAVCE